MTQEELEELISDCPILYHMAMLGSWPLVQRIGLLSTEKLADTFSIPLSEQRRITRAQRPEAVSIAHPELGEAIIRDQKPMRHNDLLRCLTGGLTPEDWYRILNERVFFWLTRERLDRLMCAGTYRDQEHIVLRVPTRPIIERYRDRIELSPMNSGCTRPMAHPRGLETFLSIDDYPYADWRQRRPRRERVVELTVIGGVPDIAELVETVQIEKCGFLGDILFQR